MRTQVCIVGGGPAGLLLSHLLDEQGIDSIVLERQSTAHVRQRIRAGVLEAGSAQLLRDHGLGERLDREGRGHDGSYIVWPGYERLLIDTKTYTGKQMIAYGQTAITEDLYAARAAAGAQIIDEANDVCPHDVTTDAPHVTFEQDGHDRRIDCEYVAGCDGSHGVCRSTIPGDVLTTFERVYPCGWLGILSRTPPVPDFIYARHQRGFALAAQRNPMLSRYYLQVPNGSDIADWPDDRFWAELKSRFPPSIADTIVTGPSIEKSIAPLRSLVVEPLRHGRLFLAGDAAHIVPPTGAKGLNLAFSDVFYLARGLQWHYTKGDDTYLDRYSEMALRRVWRAERVSWWLTTLLHELDDATPFDRRIREIEFHRLYTSRHALAALAEEYVGLPYED